MLKNSSVTKYSNTTVLALSQHTRILTSDRIMTSTKAGDEMELTTTVTINECQQSDEMKKKSRQRTSSDGTLVASSVDTTPLLSSSTSSFTSSGNLKDAKSPRHAELVIAARHQGSRSKCGGQTLLQKAKMRESFDDKPLGYRVMMVMKKRIRSTE
ncbi:hypothetical protein ACTXT7_004349 [Hymenolepis weldensis]